MQNTAMKMQRPERILVLGHSRVGKDTIAQRIAKQKNLPFISATEILAKEVFWPVLRGRPGCGSIEEMLRNKQEYREEMKEILATYNKSFALRGCRLVLNRGSAFYVGLRAAREIYAAMDTHLFTKIIWVDAGDRVKPDHSIDLGYHAIRDYPYRRPVLKFIDNSEVQE